MHSAKVVLLGEMMAACSGVVAAAHSIGASTAGLAAFEHSNFAFEIAVVAFGIDGVDIYGG
jgi:hypothetical protein